MSRFHTVEIGDEVRSYDFPQSLPRMGHCYVEGTVERIVPAGSEAVAFGCDRYAIRVKRMVWEGEQIAVPTDEPYVYPPVNGTPSMIEDANGVIRISELPPEQRSVPSAVPADLSELEVRILASLTKEEQEAMARGEPPPQAAEPRWAAGTRRLNTSGPEAQRLPPTSRRKK